jgi:hypothetical protein
VALAEGISEVATLKGNAEQVPCASRIPAAGGLRRKQILAIASAMAAVCASHPIPQPGAHHRGNLFSVAIVFGEIFDHDGFVLWDDLSVFSSLPICAVRKGHGL